MIHNFTKITDPFLDETGMKSVNPKEYYGLVFCKFKNPVDKNEENSLYILHCEDKGSTGAVHIKYVSDLPLPPINTVHFDDLEFLDVVEGRTEIERLFSIGEISEKFYYQLLKNTYAFMTKEHREREFNTYAKDPDYHEKNTDSLRIQPNNM